MYCNIIVDTNGYPYIFSTWKPFDFPSEPSFGLVHKSSTNNGYWVTADDFPKNITGSKNGCNTLQTVTGVALSNGKVYVVYNVVGSGPTFLKGRLWDGEWQDEEYISILYTSATIMVADGDTIHLISLDRNNDTVYMQKQGTWSSMQILFDQSSSNCCLPTLTELSNNNLVVCTAYLDTNHIWYKKMINGVWQDSVDYIAENPILYSNVLQANLYGDNIILLYTSGMYFQYCVRVLVI
jgi:hypothetical protein